MMRKTIRLIFALILISAMLWGLADLWSRHQLKKACEDWPLLDRNLADFLQVFPKTSTNQSAQKFEKLYLQFSRDLEEDLAVSDGFKDFREFKNALGEYLEQEFEKSTGLVDAPPAEIVAVLSRHADRLEEMAHVLVNDELPEWPFDVEAESQPRLLWSLALNRLLTVKALYLCTAGKTEQAWFYLQALARSADASFRRPEIISQLIAMVEANQILLTMRKMSAPVPPWALEWPVHDLEHDLLMAYIRHARYVLRVADSSLLSTLKRINLSRFEMAHNKISIGVRAHILSVIARPYIRLCGVHTLVAWKQMIRERFQQGLCSGPPPGFETFKEQLPNWLVLGWAVIGRILDADFPDVWGWETSPDSYRQKFYGRYKLTILLTGTRSILAAKAAKAESPDKRWPETLPEVALPCENLAWSYTVAPDGTATFEYANQLPKESDGLAKYLKYIGKPGE